MTPHRFRWALRQLFGHPETPILNLCGAGWRKYTLSSSAASSLVSMIADVQTAVPGHATRWPRPRGRRRRGLCRPPSSSSRAASRSSTWTKGISTAWRVVR